ncbi:uncharacterized protein LOC125878503 [Solanum stenotomum]|uniref:uncharacterized protein LOC125874760 n=1 Tax=Solanum stenotomum TaxID=172797 RepID=UPI0020D1224A|nr:uncharacterized protein LOC125874760 [Solanum stenotomum]XP_049415734.1 uncharacterized protein LOC125878503 [Solanum stenotomum]
MKRLWEELSTLHVKTQCKCNCSCGAKESVFRAEQERRLIQFLMGLNETYTAVRGNILMMNPLPSLAQTFSLLVQDEKQREIKPNTQLFMESTALNAGNSGKMMMESGSFNASSSGGASTSRQPRQNAAGNNNFRTNYSQTTTYNGNRGRLVCDYCRKTGHTRDRCYKLHGYPQANPQQSNNNQNSQNGYRSNNQNFRNTKGKGPMNDVHGFSSNVMTNGCEEHAGTHDTQSPKLTREQYEQFVNLLQHFQSESRGDNASNMDHVNGNVNFAGPFNEEASGNW